MANPRLPNVGSDTDAWGTVLNDYLTRGVPHSSIDFFNMYGAVDGPGGESANATAFANLITDLKNGTTFEGRRRIDFGAHHYYLNSTVALTDLEDAIFSFCSGASFNETLSLRKALLFMWTGAASTYMFAITNSGGVNQRGLHWEGVWVMGSTHTNQGYGLHINDSNNWGGPASGLAFINDGGGNLQRGIVCDNSVDNAHGRVGEFFSNNQPYPVYINGGGFAIDGGNISVAAGQTGVYVGPSGTEMKLGAAVKIDGGDGAIGVDIEGGNSYLNGVNFEGFNSGTMLRIRRTTANSISGRSNIWTACQFVGHDGTGIAWICATPTAGGFGNCFNLPNYTNCVSAKSADATMLPNGPGVIDVGFDYDRVIHQGAYHTWGS